VQLAPLGHGVFLGRSLWISRTWAVPRSSCGLNQC
jgi:hypothetical protein